MGQFRKQLKQQEQIEKQERWVGSSVSECPYCHSKDTKKISTTSKVVNTAVWGIFGTKRHKQWHCNSCNSDF